MSMKKTLMITALAAALSTTATGVVSAATATGVTSAAATLNVMVNDTAVQVRTIQAQGAAFVSLRDLGTAIGALFVVNVKAGVTGYVAGHAVELHAGSNEAIVDGEAVTLEQAVQSVGGSYYIAPEDFLTVFGVDGNVDDEGALSVDSVQKVHADAASWLDAGHLLASELTETGRNDYIVDAKTGAFKLVLASESASELTVSPNGALAAYTNEDGVVSVIDLKSSNFASRTVSTDNSIKPELVWAADSSAIYFLQGDKGTVIAKMNVADGTISTVLNDKVDYKSSLSVSKDGTKFFYVVTKPGTVTADATKPVDADDVAIDTTGTEPQVFSFDASVKDGKPVQVTSQTDDKVFVGTTTDGSKGVYVSVVDGKPSTLVAVKADKTSTTLIGDKDVLAATIVEDTVYALVINSDDTTSLIKVDVASGKTEELGKSDADVSEVIAAPGTPVAVYADGAVQVVNGTTLKKVTK
ncbi:copper amine oxidase-like protein [Paenibacillus taihuensis]|uniref:Copper amine oxidase-like protein n=1 Tax=Paenibacillus taihuensis TaxID=1156355 RepID=A0A3D9RIU7_9BACL|nr:stalk domain-containing protein [Paenibacillus taihuensis]REE78896.1 copper amine oxidase-like protein [Paenibacillus taihuensis]